MDIIEDTVPRYAVIAAGEPPLRAYGPQSVLYDNPDLAWAHVARRIARDERGTADERLDLMRQALCSDSTGDLDRYTVQRWAMTIQRFRTDVAASARWSDGTVTVAHNEAFQGIYAVLVVQLVQHMLAGADRYYGTDVLAFCENRVVVGIVHEVRDDTLHFADGHALPIEDTEKVIVGYVLEGK